MSHQKVLSLFFIVGVFLLFAIGVSGLFFAGAFNPAHLANSSDLVVHGTVTSVEPAGGLSTDRYDVNHPVTLRVIGVFKGNVGDSITIQVGGDNTTGISTAASFSEGEEVVVMLQEQNAAAHPYIDKLYYLTAGQPGKFLVTKDTIQLQEPDRKRITVEQMKEIVQNPEAVNITALPAQNISTESTEVQDRSDADVTKETAHATSDSQQDGFFKGLWKSLVSLFL